MRPRDVVLSDNTGRKSSAVRYRSAKQVNPLMGTLKLHSNRPLYNNIDWCTLAVETALMGELLHLVQRGGA